MNYINSQMDNQLKNEELVPELPPVDKIPAKLTKYENWVGWKYHKMSTGITIHAFASEPTDLASTLATCEREGYGLGFLLTPNESFAALRVAGDYHKLKEILKLAATYTAIDKNLNEYYAIAQVDGIHSAGQDDVQIYTDRFIMPITGYMAGPCGIVEKRTRQFYTIATSYCTQSWMDKVDALSREDGENAASDEAFILLKVLNECLDSPDWRENAIGTDLFPFMYRCFRYPTLEEMVLRRLREERSSFKEIDAFLKAVQDASPKKESKRGNQKPERSINDVDGESDDLDNILQYDAKGVRVIENFYNMGILLERDEYWKGRIRFDVFRNLPMLDDNPVSDTTEYRISEWLGKNYKFGGNKRQILSDAIRAVASKNQYDALLEWIDALPDWDGTQRIDTWMIDLCGSEDSDYSKWVSRVTILQMMNRALNPGCIARLVPIWNGLENQGKSTAVALLGGEWATTLKVSLENKEAHMSIHGYWIAELEELDTLYKTSEARLKAFLTNTSDHYVPKFANHSVDYPRRTVFIGTTNDSDYLRGLTGNTRFLPINTGAFDLNGIKDNREQLFAEAKEWLLENTGIAWWEEPESLRDIIKEQRDSRRVLNVYEEDLRKFLDGEGGDNYFEQVGKKGPRTPKIKYLKKTTMSDIFELYIKTESKERWKDDKLGDKLIGALKALGWYRKKANSTNWWMRPNDIDDDEVPF